MTGEDADEADEAAGDVGRCIFEVKEIVEMCFEKRKKSSCSSSEAQALICEDLEKMEDEAWPDTCISQMPWTSKKI